MKSVRIHRWLALVLGGAVVFQFGGCLGPNPGFFISTSVANATIFTLINTFLTNLIGAGGA
ncbi:MAG: hypothetical protein ACE5E1_02730 [Phycisphaerae bacterium]